MRPKSLWSSLSFAVLTSVPITALVAPWIDNLQPHYEILVDYSSNQLFPNTHNGLQFQKRQQNPLQDGSGIPGSGIGADGKPIGNPQPTFAASSAPTIIVATDLSCIGPSCAIADPNLPSIQVPTTQNLGSNTGGSLVPDITVPTASIPKLMQDGPTQTTFITQTNAVVKSGTSSAENLNLAGIDSTSTLPSNTAITPTPLTDISTTVPTDIPQSSDPTGTRISNSSLTISPLPTNSVAPNNNTLDTNSSSVFNSSTNGFYSTYNSTTSRAATDHSSSMTIITSGITAIVVAAALFHL